MKTRTLLFILFVILFGIYAVLGNADDCAPRAYMKIYMCGATYEMRVGPSEPTCRSRLQTASSCAG